MTVATNIERNVSSLLQEKCFGILWRLTLLSLPWQARWLMSRTSLSGWPWEQGGWSVYVSWILLVVTCLVGWRIVGRRVVWRPVKLSLILALIFFLSTLLPLLTQDWRVKLPAIAQWWMHASLLTVFIWTLWRTRVSSQQIGLWFVISLLPHVVLGLYQHAVQRVSALSWLGIAEQDPRNLGVSVIEAGDLRVLRAYGGFPHPNIFGGWLALGLVVTIFLASQVTTKLRAVGWSLIAAVTSLALLLTYARGAWLAAVLGSVTLLLTLWRSRASSNLQFGCIALLCSILLTGAIAWTQVDLIRARVSRLGRLELKSLVTRQQSYKDGWRLLKSHPWFGTGLNAELFDLARIKSKPREPLEPPHNAYLLALVNVGSVGVILLLGWVWISLRQMPMLLPLVLTVMTLGLFDHYLWSLWAGQVLVALTVGLAGEHIKKSLNSSDLGLDR